MTDQQQPEPTGTPDGEDQVVVVGPDGQPIGTIPASALPAMTEATDDGDGEGDDGERHITELVEQPAKVMRIGSMIRQLLEEVKAAPLDEASRNRLKDIHAASIKELESGLAPELVEGLEDNRLFNLLHDGGSEFFALGQIKVICRFLHAFADFLVGDAFFLGPVLNREINGHGFAQMLAQFSGLPLLGIGVVGHVF